MVSVERVGDNSCRSVLAVSGTEGVVNVNVSVRSELLCEVFLTTLHLLLCLVILGCAFLYAYGLAFLLGIEAQVLEQQSLATLQSGSSLACVATVLSKLNVYAEGLRYVRNDLLQRQFGVNLALGLAHVAHHDECTTVGQHLLKGGQGTANTGVVSYVSVLVQGHVEVNAYNCLLTGKIEICDFHFFFLFLISEYIS